MLDAASPVIQVVTTGTDWPAIAAVISTGIVGLVGIGGTIWQAKRNWSKEDYRAKVAEKRRIYVACLTAYNTAYDARIYLETHSSSQKAFDEYRSATQTCLTAVYELLLVAPSDIRNLGHEILASLVNSLGDSSLFNDTLVELLKAMRADLGDPITPGAIPPDLSKIPRT